MRLITSVKGLYRACGNILADNPGGLVLRMRAVQSILARFAAFHGDNALAHPPVDAFAILKKNSAAVHSGPRAFIPSPVPEGFLQPPKKITQPRAPRPA